MNLLVLCLLKVLLSICGGELLISFPDTGKHWLFKDDLKLDKKFNTEVEGEPYPGFVKARKSDGGLEIFISQEKEIKRFTLSKDGKVSKSGKFPINILQKDPSFSFNVHPSENLVAATSGSKLYISSKVSNELTLPLESYYPIKDVFFHPTRPEIYYSTCPIGQSNSLQNFLVVYDLSKKIKKETQLPTCFERMIFDFKDNVIWALAYNSFGLVMLRLDSGIVEEVSRGINHDFTNGGPDSLFITKTEDKDKHSQEREAVILKFSKNVQIQKQTTLQDYKHQPALSHFKKTTYVLFNIDGGLIEILDNQFARTTDKSIKLDLTKQPIKSIRSLNSDTYTTFFWIHHSNKGEVEYVQINHADLTIKSRDKFTFRIGEVMEDLIDFDVHENDFLVITSEELFKAEINYENLQQKNLQPFGQANHGPNKAMAMMKKQEELFVFKCSGYITGGVKDPWGNKNSKIHGLVPCPKQILSDEEAGILVVSTSTGLFSFQGEHQFEKIYSGMDLRNFALDKDFVYFVSKTDGPGIYKVPKRRSVRVDRELGVDLKGFFRIAYVQEIVKDVKKQKEKNPDKSVASVTTSAEKMCLLLLIRFAMNLLP